MARIATSQNHTALLSTLSQQQERISTYQQQVATGLRIHRPSDDPVAAAQAERARSQLARIDTTRRTLEVQRSAVELAEAALGEGAGILLEARDTLLTAGKTTLNAADRQTLGDQLLALRERLIAQANRTDTQGVPLFGGLGTAQGVPAFADMGGGVQFLGAAGQARPGVDTLPHSLDGSAIWLDLRQGNGVFVARPASTNAGTAWADTGSVTDPSDLTGEDYALSFGAGPAGTTVTVTNTRTGDTVLNQPYEAGKALAFDGISVAVHGQPAAGDAILVGPSARTDVFAVLADAAQALRSGRSGWAGDVKRSLAEVDGALQNLSSARSLTGQWLARADAMDSAQQDQRVAQDQARSAAEDADLVQSISQLQSAQTGMQAALKSYASVQSMSLFDYLKL